MGWRVLLHWAISMGAVVRSRSRSSANTLRLMASTVSKPSRPLTALSWKRLTRVSSMEFLMRCQPPHRAVILASWANWGLARVELAVHDRLLHVDEVGPRQVLADHGDRLAGAVDVRRLEDVALAGAAAHQPAHPLGRLLPAGDEPLRAQDARLGVDPSATTCPPPPRASTSRSTGSTCASWPSTLRPTSS